MIKQTRDEETIAWVTDRGYLYVGGIDRRGNDAFLSTFRANTNGTFNNPPVYLPPNPKKTGDSGIVFGGSSDGYVYAISERGGEVWKFSASEPVVDSPVVIEDRVYATTELGGLFCINIATGKQVWWAPEILHFVAQGKERVYASDRSGRLRILDARNGAMLDCLPTSTMPIKVSNGQTDRIYLATEGGTIQCLRELEQVAPLAYNESRKPLPEEEIKSQPKPKSRTAEAGEPKAAADRPAKKAKKDAADDAFGGDADVADKPAKTTKAAKTAKGKAAKKDAADDGGAFGDAEPAAKPAKGGKAAKKDAADDGGVFGDAEPAAKPAKGKAGGAKKDADAGAADPFQ